MRRQRSINVNDEKEGEANSNAKQQDALYSQQIDADTFLSQHVTRIRNYVHDSIIRDVSIRLNRLQDTVRVLREERPKVEDFKGVDDVARFFDETEDNNNNAAGGASNLQDEEEFMASLPLSSIAKQQQQQQSTNNNKTNHTEDDLDRQIIEQGKSVIDTKIVTAAIASSAASIARDKDFGDAAAAAAHQQEKSSTSSPQTAFILGLHASRVTTKAVAAAAAATKTNNNNNNNLIQVASNGKDKQESAASRIAQTIANVNSEPSSDRINVIVTTNIGQQQQQQTKTSSSASPPRPAVVVAAIETKVNQDGSANDEEKSTSTRNNNAAVSSSSSSSGGGTVIISKNPRNNTTVTASSPYKKISPVIKGAKAKEKPPLPLPLISSGGFGAGAGGAMMATTTTTTVASPNNNNNNNASPRSATAIRQSFLESIGEKKGKLIAKFAVPKEEEVRVNTKLLDWTMPESLRVGLLQRILDYAAKMRKEALEMVGVYQELGAYILLSSGPSGANAAEMFSPETLAAVYAERPDAEERDFGPRDRDVADLVLSNTMLMVNALLGLANHRSQVLANLLKIEKKNPIATHMLSTCNQGVAQMLLASWDFILKGFLTLRRLACLMHNLLAKNWQSLENLHILCEKSSKSSENRKVAKTLKRKGNN